MSELRWIIALVGLAVIAALYAWGRRRASSRRAEEGRVEPRLESATSRAGPGAPEGPESEWIQFPEGEIRREPLRSTPSETGRSPGMGAESRSERGRRKIVVLYVRAAAGRDFAGRELLEAFEGEGLKFGKYGAFHQLDDKGQSLFAIANMMEPGSFPIDDMDSFSTVGITTFMVLPGPGGVDGLARMVACCRRLASILGGEVLDENRSTLTNQRATHMKEEIIEFLRQERLDPSGLGPGSA